MQTEHIKLPSLAMPAFQVAGTVVTALDQLAQLSHSFLEKLRTPPLDGC